MLILTFMFCTIIKITALYKIAIYSKMFSDIGNASASFNGTDK